MTAIGAKRPKATVHRNCLRAASGYAGPLPVTIEGKSELETIELVCVGRLKCPNCTVEIPAWRSSGMSQMYPHFYCSDCSNVIHRQKDQHLVWRDQSSEVLEVIASSLPDCECGGKFVPGANPKCPSCHYDFRHQSSPLTRLSDPHVILIDGSVKYGDDGPKYKVLITLASEERASDAELRDGPKRS